MSAAGNEAFSNCINLRTVQLSAQLTELGIRSFAGCTALTAIQIPAALKTLGANAFDGCTALESVFIPASLETVQTNRGSFGSPFTGCSNLSRISFGDGIESIPAHLFSGCDFLTRMEIPETVTSISNDAFVNCANLRTVLVSNLLCAVGNSAFRNCPGLTLYCPAPSFTAVYAIENGVPFQPSGVLTLDLPSETAKDTVTASGLAPASSVVALSVDGAPAGSVIASKAGSWSAQVPLRLLQLYRHRLLHPPGRNRLPVQRRRLQAQRRHHDLLPPGLPGARRGQDLRPDEHQRNQAQGLLRPRL